MYTLKKILILPFLLFAFTAAAQDASDCFYQRNVNEVGFLGGTSYYMGDFNTNLTPFKSPSWYAGILYRYNFKRYFAFRTQMGYGYVRGTGEGMEELVYDITDNNWKFNRPWIFVDFISEFNFMPYNAADIRKKQRFTPVLLLGVGASYLMSNTIKPAEGALDGYARGASPFTFNIPVGIGAKWCFAPRMTLGVEWIWRISFYNKIDYYNFPVKHSPTISNDWIGTVGITLSYLIKQNVPCAATTRYQPSTRKFSGTIQY